MEKELFAERTARIEEILKKYRAVTPPVIPAVSRRGKPRMTVDFGGADAEHIAGRDLFYMDAALELASAAAEYGEVPVGALVVRGGDILAADFNGREGAKNALYHAETAVISAACAALGGWRLPGCELYVTLEPCAMCAGAVVSARVPRVVFGASDKKAGAYGGRFDLRDAGLNHTPEVVSGVREDEAAELLRRFFSGKREWTRQG